MFRLWIDKKNFKKGKKSNLKRRDKLVNDFHAAFLYFYCSLHHLAKLIRRQSPRTKGS